MECSICLNTINPEKDDYTDLDCGHSFHTKCINMWLNVNNSCPNCRNIVLTVFKCRYTPYPFLPFLMRKDCVLKIQDNSILIQFTRSNHLRHYFRLEDIKSVLLVGSSIVIKHKEGEDFRGNPKFKNFSYDFEYVQSAMNIFNTSCHKLNQDYVSSNNYPFQL